MADREWERVNTESSRHPRRATAYTDRLKVPGGWIYRCAVRTRKAQNQYGEEISMCFVPDPLEAAP